MNATVDLDFLHKMSEQFDRPDESFRETTANVSRLLYAVARLARPRMILELGCHVGATTCWLARAAAEMDGPSRVIAYDNNAEFVSKCRSNLAKLLGERSNIAEVIEPDALMPLNSDHAAADFV